MTIGANGETWLFDDIFSVEEDGNECTSSNPTPTEKEYFLFKKTKRQEQFPDVTSIDTDSAQAWKLKSDGTTSKNPGIALN